MFYNEKGQLCLRRFDFEAIRACPSATLNRWHVQKIFGDECHVFMLKVPEASSCTEGFHQNQMRSKIPNDDERNLEGDREVVAGNKQHMSQSSLVAKTNANVPFMASVKSVAEKSHVSQPPNQASSVAETHRSSHAVEVFSHGGSHQSCQQEGLHDPHRQ